VAAEPLNWKHGVVPGILAHFQVEEVRIIQTSVAVFVLILASWFCAWYFAGPGSGRESLQKQRSSSRKFIEGQDPRDLRGAILKKMWADARNESQASDSLGTITEGEAMLLKRLLADAKPASPGEAKEDQPQANKASTGVDKVVEEKDIPLKAESEGL